MTILSIDDFRAALVPGDRLLALDVGAKTIGLATALWGGDMAMPYRTLARTKFTTDAAAIRAVIDDLGVQGLVIGWPLLPDGTPGKRCQSVKDFTFELDRFLTNTWPITFYDERFSTQAGDEKVDHIGKTAGKSVGKTRDAIIDSLAAQKILEDFLLS